MRQKWEHSIIMCECRQKHEHCPNHKNDQTPPSLTDLSAASLPVSALDLLYSALLLEKFYLKRQPILSWDTPASQQHPIQRSPASLNPSPKHGNLNPLRPLLYPLPDGPLIPHGGPSPSLRWAVGETFSTTRVFCVVFGWKALTIFGDK